MLPTDERVGHGKHDRESVARERQKRSCRRARLVCHRGKPVGQRNLQQSAVTGVGEITALGVGQAGIGQPRRLIPDVVRYSVAGKAPASRRLPRRTEWATRRPSPGGFDLGAKGRTRWSVARRLGLRRGGHLMFLSVAAFLSRCHREPSAESGSGLLSWA
jgi:hypothetical protein